MAWWLYGGGAAAVMGLAWLLFFAGRHRFAYRPATLRPPEDREHGTLETVLFPAVDGARLEGWLILPKAAKPPIVVMAPGLTGTKEGPLERFAWCFAAAGYAVLMLDLRSFGGSGGEPRHWLDPLRQIEDYRSAIAFIETGLADRVDAQRIVLWGSSFSGAAAVCAAAGVPHIAAVVAQVPYLGGVPVHPPVRRQIAGYIALNVTEMLGDAIIGWFGVTLDPVYITTYGKPGERVFAMSADNPAAGASSDALHPFWASLPQPPRGGWENRMLVRGLQNLDKISPLEELAKITCPILLIGAMRDDMIAFAKVREAAGRLASGGSRFVQFDCGHYDPYVAPLFEANVTAQIDFLRATLR